MALEEHLFHRLELTIVMEQFDQCPRTLAEGGEKCSFFEDSFRSSSLTMLSNLRKMNEATMNG